MTIVNVFTPTLRINKAQLVVVDGEARALDKRRGQILASWPEGDPSVIVEPVAGCGCGSTVVKER